MGSIASTLGHKRKEIPQPDPALAIPDAMVGIEVECENFRTSKPVPDLWSAKTDGSLRNSGIEFVTNGGMMGNQIFRSVDSICKYAKEGKLSVGYPRAGIHIHLDCTDLNSAGDRDLWNMCQVYLLVEHMMFGFCTQIAEEKSEWRRWCGYCDSLEDSRQDYEMLAKVLIDWKNLKPATIRANLNNTSKYQAVNFIPLLTLGTVEFRHLPTTFDAGLIKQWINMILAIKRAATTAFTKPDFDLCSEFSRKGPKALILGLLGEYVKPFLPYLNETACWAAVDAIQAMAGYARADTKRLAWEEPDNPLLIAKFGNAPAKSATKARKTAPEPLEVRWDGDMFNAPNFDIPPLRVWGEAPPAPPPVLVRNATPAPVGRAAVIQDSIARLTRSLATWENAGNPAMVNLINREIAGLRRQLAELEQR